MGVTAPRLAPALVPLKASEPYHAWAVSVVESAPVNLRRTGMPLCTVVMPEICQPFRMPRVRSAEGVGAVPRLGRVRRGERAGEPQADRDAALHRRDARDLPAVQDAPR